MNWIRCHIFILFLLALGIIIAAANYTPGTFLSGWDTLHPEFNVPLAFNRTISGVWRFDQGLGAVAAHSHMTELPRLLLLWFSSIILPLSMIRYAFFFLCLIIGIIGMYVLISDATKNKCVAFAGAITYLANLGVVQIFIVPFEMFAIEYAVLPWIILTAKNFLTDGGRRNLLLFLITMVLAAPMAYAATLWYAFFACFTLYCLLWKTFKRAAILITVTILLNLYWILPNMHVTIFHGKEITETKINRLFTPEAYAKNQEFGNIKDVPILKNFLFDWQLLNTKTNQFEEVTTAWQKHLENPTVAGFGYAVFVLSFIGIVQTIKQRNKVGIAMLPFFIVPFLLLLNGTWPMNNLFAWITRISPVTAEALRFPFTKFSIMFMLAESFYLAEGIYSSSLSTRSLLVLGFQPRTIINSIAIIFSILSLWYFLPAFQGNLIHPAMRVAIPNEYFEMFRWFQTQPTNQRVAILPIDTFWGWTYYSWGYQGAGFLQFGIPQPIMDRDYNRWSAANERYQQEMSYAVYSQNPAMITDVLAKYHIRWILLDTSVISPGNTTGSLLTWKIPALLTQTGHVSLAKTFGNDVVIYKVDDIQPRFETILPDVDATDHFTGKTSGTPVATVAGARYVSTDSPKADHIGFPNLPHDQAYAVSVVSKNIAGFPLELCVSNNLTRHCDLFTHLEMGPAEHTETFLLPPLSDYGTGYTLNFNNFAIPGQTSVNELKSVTVMIATVLLAPAKQTDAVTNNQSFEPGWIAWDGKHFLPHTMVNGWENGWVVKSDRSDQYSNVTIFFVPQLLEWLGFLLMPLPFIVIIIYDKH